MLALLGQKNTFYMWLTLFYSLLIEQGHRPLSPRAPSPGNLLERPITPSSGRLSPLDGIMGKKKSKVMPTEEDLPNVDSVRHTPEPMEG